MSMRFEIEIEKDSKKVFRRSGSSDAFVVLAEVEAFLEKECDA
jgi:hypothetical protein